MNSLYFITNSLFENITYDKDADSWNFAFADKIFLNVSGFWRMFQNNHIRIVSLDHGHKFGLPQQFNLIDEVKKNITNQALKRIEISKNTGDLNLILTNQFKIEVYITSIGYETYDLSLKNKRYIGLGSGEIAIIDI